MFIAGAVLAVLGAFLVAAAVAVEQRPYVPPPGCETTACPTSDIGAQDALRGGLGLVVAGVGLLFASALVPVDRRLTRADEELLLERIEGTRRVD